MKKQLQYISLLAFIFLAACEKDYQKINVAGTNENITASLLPRGTIYIGSTDSNVYAIDAVTLKDKWKFSTAGPIYGSTVCISGNILYINAYKTIYALDKNSGALIWSYNLGHESYSSPFVKDSVVYAAAAPGLYSEQGTVVALNAYTGQLIWKVDSLVHGYLDASSSPTVVDGILYIGTGNRNSICALDAANGNILWEVTKPKNFYSSPCVAYNRVYIFCGNNTLYSFNAKTGKQLWRFKTADSYTLSSSSASVHGKTVYCIDGIGRYTFALDARTGAMQWKFDAGIANDDKFSPLAVYGTVFTCSAGNIYALDSANGSVKWQRTLTSSFVTSSPTYANGIIYITAYDNGYGHLYELNAVDGTIVGTYDFPSQSNMPNVSSAVIVNYNEKVFYPTISGMKQ